MSNQNLPQKIIKELLNNFRYILKNKTELKKIPVYQVHFT